MGAVRAWALLDTLLSSGLRASEVAALRVGDCLLGYGQASLVVRQGKGGQDSGGVFYPAGAEGSPEGLPDVEEGSWRKRLRRSPHVHRAARPTHPERRLASGQEPHGGREAGFSLRHPHVSPYPRDSPLPGQRRRLGGRPGAVRVRQNQDHDDLRQGHQGGQGSCCGRPGEGLPRLATE